MSAPPQKKDRFTSPPIYRQPKVFLPLAGLLVLVGGISIFLGSSRTSTDSGEFYQVRRGNMRISITEGGTLRAAEEVRVTSKLEAEADIIYLIPEGTLVEEGDLLVELDSSDLQEVLTERQIRYEDALSNFTESRESFSIKKSEAASEIKLAELTAEFAKSDLEKYLEGDWPQTKNEAQNAITVAQAELKRAQDRLTYTRELAEQEYVTRTELEADELEVTRNELAFENAKEKLRLLTKYEYPKQVRKLESDVEQAEAALDRTKSRFAAELAQAEGSLKAREATLELEKNRLDRISAQLENTRIYAPQEGLVIYATYRDWRSGGNERPLEAGASVVQRQELISLPDLSKMLVQVKIHESQRYQVREGLPAFVTIDSFPDQRFRGTVSRISVLPDAESRWLNPDLKVYTTEIIIDDEIPELNPGVSARAEILVDELADVLQIPIQSVSTIDGERVVYRSTRDGPEAIPVQIGSFNDSFIEIQSGLIEGDWVLLSSPRRRPDRSNGKTETEKDDENTFETEEIEETSPSFTATIESGAN